MLSVRGFYSWLWVSLVAARSRSCSHGIYLGWVSFGGFGFHRRTKKDQVWSIIHTYLESPCSEKQGKFTAGHRSVRKEELIRQGPADSRQGPDGAMPEDDPRLVEGVEVTHAVDSRTG